MQIFKANIVRGACLTNSLAGLLLSCGGQKTNILYSFLLLLLINFNAGSKTVNHLGLTELMCYVVFIIDPGKQEMQ